jgi:hypothetical protein
MVVRVENVTPTAPLNIEKNLLLGFLRQLLEAK